MKKKKPGISLSIKRITITVVLLLVLFYIGKNIGSSSFGVNVFGKVMTSPECPSCTQDSDCKSTCIGSLVDLGGGLTIGKGDAVQNYVCDPEIGCVPDSVVECDIKTNTLLGYCDEEGPSLYKVGICVPLADPGYCLKDSDCHSRCNGPSVPLPYGGPIGDGNTLETFECVLGECILANSVPCDQATNTRFGYCNTASHGTLYDYGVCVPLARSSCKPDDPYGGCPPTCDGGEVILEAETGDNLKLGKTDKTYYSCEPTGEFNERDCIVSNSENCAESTGTSHGYCSVFSGGLTSVGNCVGFEA